MDASLSRETTSPGETVELGRSLAARLHAGDIVAIYGGLGTGKTHFAKGICAGLGITADHVTSPTFVLINEYYQGRLPVYHFDTYRLRSLDEFLALGYEEYFEGAGICLIEWPEPIASLLPREVIEVHLRHSGESRRLVEIRFIQEEP